MGDLGRIVAIEIVGGTTRTVEEGDTLRLHARAIDAAGDSVVDPGIVWDLLNPDSAGFTLDSTTGLVTAVTVGVGRVQARVENLTSGLIIVTVTGAPDSVGPAGAQRLVVGPGDTASAPLTVGVFDLTTDPGAQLALGGTTVQFDMIEPAPGTAEAQTVRLARTDTVTVSDPHAVAVTTDAAGQAGVLVARVAGSTQPDSALVDAWALTARGDTVAGSPVRFVVLFENN